MMGGGSYNYDYGFDPYLVSPSTSYGQDYYTGFEYAHGLYPTVYSVGDNNLGGSTTAVEEITVDDVMDSLIQALSNDRDVFQVRK